MGGEACPSADMFTNITLGQCPRLLESPSPGKELMRNALRMSLLLGLGFWKRDQSRSTYAPRSSVGKVEEQNADREEKDDLGENAEALLFPEGRKWDESMKPIPPYRLLFSALLQDSPSRDEEWKEFVKSAAEKMVEFDQSLKSAPTLSLTGLSSSRLAG